MTTCYKEDSLTCTVQDSKPNDQFKNLNLNQNQSFFKNESAKSFSTSSSNTFKNHQQQNNFVGRKDSNFMNQKDEWSKKSLGLSLYTNSCNDNDKRKLSSSLSKTKETNNSTLSLYIAAYEANIAEAASAKKEQELKDDEEEATVKSKKNIFGGKKWKHVKQLFTNNSMKSPFEIPRGNDDDDKKFAVAAVPEVMQFKASQKLFNPNALNVSQNNGQNNQILNGGGGGDVDMETDSPKSNPVIIAPGTMDIGIGKPITLSDFIKRIFRAWPGYQLAIKHQLGGSSTNEIHEWLCQITTEYVEKTPQLDRDTLAEWLDQIFDNEFGLVLDDSSTDVFSNAILRGAKLLREGGPVEEMKKQWDALKEEGGTISKAEGQEDDESGSSSEGDDDGDNNDDDEPMEEDKPTKQQSKGSRFVEGDDGWTQVCRR